jgi:thiol-disulfide isomerase/thioredoxin
MSRFLQKTAIYAITIACVLGVAGRACAVERSASKPGEPTDAKARKTFASAEDWQKHGKYPMAIESYRKANQQDGGHCTECLQRAYKLAMQIGDYKDAVEIARATLSQAGTGSDQAAARYRTALALQNLGMATRKDNCFTESCVEFAAALEQMPQLIPAHFGLGISYARLHQDDAARREFSTFLAQDKSAPTLRERAQRFLGNIELARATMAPPFSLVTLDGQHVSMDGLAGKVVLLDFWATWCTPCREALPHIQSIARRFAGQPLVVLSISLDSDEAKWKDFVAKNRMTWLQYRDGGFTGPLAAQFGVRAIPATFSIDADGVLQDQHVGDAEIEWKLRKMVARATELANRKVAEPAAEKSGAAIE